MPSALFPMLTYSLSNVYLQWERVKQHNEELSERADTAEFQISTISKEYRKLFQEKEVSPRLRNCHLFTRCHSCIRLHSCDSFTCIMVLEVMTSLLTNQ